MDDFGIAGKLFLPVAIVTAAAIMPSSPAVSVPEPAPVTVTVPELPAPIVNVTVPEFPAVPAPEPAVVNVAPAEPVVIEEQVEVEVEKRVEVPVEKIVEKEVEVRTCLVWDELPSWDLTKALMATRPGEPWSLNGDYYSGLNWLGDTPKPTETELIAGWLADLEEQCDAG